MRPVLYLDVDGVLWDLPRNPGGKIHSGEPQGARGVEEFIDFVLEHFEVRWCTTWAMVGYMRPETLRRLADHTGVPAETWAKVQPSKGWSTAKHQNIDAEEHRTGRPFVWVEDELLPKEHQWLRGNHWHDHYFHTDVFKDPDALVKTTRRLQAWLAMEGSAYV